MFIWIYLFVARTSLKKQIETEYNMKPKHQVLQSQAPTGLTFFHLSGLAVRLVLLWAPWASGPVERAGEVKNYSYHFSTAI